MRKSSFEQQKKRYFQQINCHYSPVFRFLEENDFYLISSQFYYYYIFLLPLSLKWSNKLPERRQDREMVGTSTINCVHARRVWEQGEVLRNGCFS